MERDLMQEAGESEMDEHDLLKMMGEAGEDEQEELASDSEHDINYNRLEGKELDSSEEEDIIGAAIKQNMKNGGAPQNGHKSKEDQD